MDGQHSARVNIDDRDWIRFRIRAMRQQRSIADYLGDLVRAELAGRDAVETGGAASKDAAPAAVSEEDRRRDEPASATARGERIRLSDVQLFTLHADAQTESTPRDP